MSSNVTAATARQLTATAKAAVPGARFTTSSQGPYSFRVVLADLGTSPVAELSAAGLAVHAITSTDGGSRFTGTWGRDRRSGKLVINVTDETAREAEVQQLADARDETMARELGYVSVDAYRGAPGRTAVLADPELSGEIRTDEHGARYWTAEEIRAEKAAQQEVAASDRGGHPPHTTAEAEELWESGLVLISEGGSYSFGVEVARTHQRLGKVRAVTESLGRGTWVRFAAYRPDGSRVGHAPTRPEAARLLLPLSEQAQETLADAAAEAAGHPAGAASRWSTGNPSLWV